MTYTKINPERKQLEPVRVSTPPRIDGIIDEEVWKLSMLAGDFIQYMPYNGRVSGQRTEVRILYDNSAIYVAAFMYDSNPDSIYRELGERDADRMLNADNFSIEICPYNDGINGFRFRVSASGVQSDSRIDQEEPGQRGSGGSSRTSGGGMTGPGMSGGSGRTDNWDAVWDSEVSINSEGWVAEIRIPYSALRFPKERIQNWGINFWREIRRTRESSSWNYVNRDIGSTINQLGELINITDVTPPLRLSLTPYLSGYLETNSEIKGASFNYNGGLDLKYGVNESFTLDVTLVPDFGQVQSDDKILNLTPYEVKYNEKRPFFMEGTELFSKGDIFYSRRIGSKPRGYNDPSEQLSINEIVSLNPLEAELINASKFSGRTRKGLGIGIFNAMTKAMFATIRDTITDQARMTKTEPFTNFNMVVLDQNLANNSYISIANTNVWRDAFKDERYYTANVTATDFNIQSKNRLYSVEGKDALSQNYYEENNTEFGHSYSLRFGKTGGMFRLEYELAALSETYDPNDMGYLRRNNEFNNSINISYNITKPFWRILSSRNSVQYSYSQLYSPRVFTGNIINMSSFTTFRNYLTLNVRFEISPGGSNDYYEPRKSGRYYHRGSELMSSLWISTNRNRKFSVSIMGSNTKIWSDYNQRQLTLSVSPSLRLSNKFSLSHQLGFIKSFNDIGYVNNNSTTGEIYFGQRNNRTVSNTFTTAYIFTAKSYLSFRLRHYWSVAEYDNSFYLLNSDGTLESNSYTGNHNNNFNTFNIDMTYTWRFAPGSEMTLVWKNSIYSSTDHIFDNFRDNLGEMFKSPQANSLSLKILYYFDYQYLKKRS